ncbi:hypothetical protein CE143_20110 [Photorhabdus luminescens]|uniref:DUF551 domain-containing protein n=1 Tax=Photorhabdus akhurstii TaxID=171438 RepID=A0ABX8LY43_9GAMM|nr:DUF551 domain-containing protein [Photorhabdus akhurstii]QXF35216.1 hypothetical protein B0X70_20065 [Photorhabdus akhurstii]UJD77049.1 hypothetical protein CE143_20110 [Photorhabdus luminescens]
MNWIKCSDRLPELDMPVFAGWFNADGEFFWGCYVRTISDFEINEWLWSICDDFGRGDWWLDDDYSMITHWMPLPQPPKEL